ncbi:MAG: MFS transporter [Pseudomonadota bacterium]|nr:MFS transporter [Pseudomonadota bacterium]
MSSRTRWLIGGLMFLGGMINYLDRSALAVAAPFITKDLNLGPAELGIVFSAFSLGYAPFCFVGGWLSDRFGPKRVMAGAMVMWSLFCGLTAAAFNLISLLLIRVLFGFSEGPIGSTTNKMVRNWFPHREQATAVGIANAGTPLGAALSGPVVGFLAIAVGWRVSFIAITVIGVFWVVFWIALTTDRPEQNRRVGEEEREKITEGQKSQPGDPSGATPPLGQFLRRTSGAGDGVRFLQLLLHPVLLPDVVPELSHHGAPSQRQKYELCHHDPLVGRVRRLGRRGPDL